MYQGRRARKAKKVAIMLSRPHTGQAKHRPAFTVVGNVCRHVDLERLVRAFKL